MADLLWTANTLQIYPATLQNFSVGSLLPAVIYMFRRGFRRGRGNFSQTFSPGTNTRPTIWYVSGKLSQLEQFEGFESEISKDILGDLLLADALENKGGAEGHSSEILRAFPAHYYSSWLDLPQSVADLRFVPEMLVALLADQKDVDSLASCGEGDFTVGRDPERNPLLRIFGKGVIYGNNALKLAGEEADDVNESADFSLEEWLMVQLGRTCGQSPEKLRAAPSISANQPIANGAAGIFRSDMENLIKNFGRSIPRRGLSPMLECLIGIGLWQTFLASLGAAIHWERNHELPDLKHCPPFYMFADASTGSDSRLRDLAEASGFELIRFVHEATNALAVVRVSHAAARDNLELVDHVPNVRGMTKWLNLLGQARSGGHAASAFFRQDLFSKCNRLRNKLEEQDGSSEAAELLGSRLARQDPARALAEALTLCMGNKMLQTKYFMFLDSAGMSNEPHGLLKKRKVTRRLESGRTQRGDARSVILSNALLDTLVHTQLAKEGHTVSFQDFLRALKVDYGILVDEAPAGVSADREDLLRNRSILEKRLRDLGLLTGVNDAESMKRLRTRYRTTENPSTL